MIGSQFRTILRIYLTNILLVVEITKNHTDNLVSINSTDIQQWAIKTDNHINFDHLVIQWFNTLQLCFLASTLKVLSLIIHNKVPVVQFVCH